MNAESEERERLAHGAWRRIVRRDRGRIWADARLDEGANFNFTIP